jgi:hypothetical protein
MRANNPSFLGYLPFCGPSVRERTGARSTGLHHASGRAYFSVKGFRALTERRRSQRRVSNPAAFGKSLTENLSGSALTHQRHIVLLLPAERRTILARCRASLAVIIG